MAFTFHELDRRKREREKERKREIDSGVIIIYLFIYLNIVFCLIFVPSAFIINVKKIIMTKSEKK